MTHPAWVRFAPDVLTRAQWQRGWSRINRQHRPPELHTRRAGMNYREASAYRDYLRTTHWRKFRGLVLICADFRCARCTAIAEAVHHLNYECLFGETFADVEPLCHACHELEHEGDGLRRLLRGLPARVRREVEARFRPARQVARNGGGL